MYHWVGVLLVLGNLSLAGILQHVCPLPACAGMCMLKVLSEVVCPEEFLVLVAFAELVHFAQMVVPRLPIRRVRELFAAVAANIYVVLFDGRRVESCFWSACDGRAAPRVFSKVERVLVAFGLVLVLEAVRAVLAAILLLHFMHLEIQLVIELLWLLRAALAHKYTKQLWSRMVFWPDGRLAGLLASVCLRDGSLMATRVGTRRAC